MNLTIIWSVFAEEKLERKLGVEIFNSRDSGWADLAPVISCGLLTPLSGSCGGR